MPVATQTKDRSKALATALAQIDKSFGKGSVMHGYLAALSVVMPTKARMPATNPP